MASLQARHSRACALVGRWTRADAEGCTCSPRYSIVVREGKAIHREPAGRNRQQAERLLRKVGTAEDEGTYTPTRKISFDAWCDEWLASVELKPSTRRSYATSLALAKASFCNRDVRSLRPDDVRRFLADLRRRQVGTGDEVHAIAESTRAGHLRALSICLNAAVKRGFAGRNPCRELEQNERPRPPQRESGYFADGELPPLFAALDDEADRTLFLVLLKTGLRIGEASALTWADVRLAEALIVVRRSVTEGELSSPKSATSRRRVDLAADLVETLGEWWGACGKPADDVLVFPGASGGFLNASTARLHLYGAMSRAGIPREGENGERRTVHSFRHTFARVALESGRPIFWLSRHLGHSSLDITSQCYGHWSREEAKRQAEQMTGVFGV